jgi:hypothetical protein
VGDLFMLTENQHQKAIVLFPKVQIHIDTQLLIPNPIDKALRHLVLVHNFQQASGCVA